MKTTILEFKIANEDWEFEQIHQLNYKTFVNEIPQHEANYSGILIDKFHEENTYIVCVRDKKVLGMLAIRDQRPFSLEYKIDHFADYLPQHRSICEIRLLTVVAPYRNTLVFTGLIKRAMQLCMQKNYDLAVISGTVRQLKLYKHLGFVSFAHLVGKPQALYQPMYITLQGAQRLVNTCEVFREYRKPQAQRNNYNNYLPGPVQMDDEVLRAYSAVPVSHRQMEFVADFRQLRQQLCQLVNAKNMQIFHGSGTLANDIVAAHLRALPGRGLILANGEFSHRLVLHAEAAGLDFDVLVFRHGYAPDMQELERYLAYNVDVSWVWTVWCETSTGVLNDIVRLRRLKKRYDFALCLDAISAIGVLPVDLQDVYMATAVSGKGLAAQAGLAMVFYDNNIIVPPDYLPRYFDLGYYEAQYGVPFTISSNAIHALQKAIEHTDWETQYTERSLWYRFMLTELEKLGLTVVAKMNPAAHILTVALPAQCSSVSLGQQLQRHGYYLSYQSDYLIRQNWIQICFMGRCESPSKAFIGLLKELLMEHKRSDSKSA